MTHGPSLHSASVLTHRAQLAVSLVLRGRDRICRGDPHKQHMRQLCQATRHAREISDVNGAGSDSFRVVLVPGGVEALYGPFLWTKHPFCFGNYY